MARMSLSENISSLASAAIPQSDTNNATLYQFEERKPSSIALKMKKKETLLDSFLLFLHFVFFLLHLLFLLFFKEHVSAQRLKESFATFSYQLLTKGQSTFGGKMQYRYILYTNPDLLRLIPGHQSYMAFASFFFFNFEQPLPISKTYRAQMNKIAL